MDTQYACEESVFNIVRCNWADEVEDSAELQLADRSSSGSDMSTTCGYPKPDHSLSLNLFRTKKGPDRRGPVEAKHPGQAGLRHHSSQKKKKSKGEPKPRALDAARRKTDPPRKGPLLDLEGLGEDAWKGLTSLGSRADSSRDWKADKAGGGEGKTSARKKGLSGGSGSSTSRSGSSTARSVASRADTEEWTRPLRVNPEASARHGRSSSDTWRSGSSVSSASSKRSNW